MRGPPRHPPRSLSPGPGATGGRADPRCRRRDGGLGIICWGKRGGRNSLLRHLQPRLAEKPPSTGARWQARALSLFPTEQARPGGVKRPPAGHSSPGIPHPQPAPTRNHLPLHLKFFGCGWGEKTQRFPGRQPRRVMPWGFFLLAFLFWCFDFFSSSKPQTSHVLLPKPRIIREQLRRVKTRRGEALELEVVVQGTI